jgi:hypothetical protein
MYQTRLLPVEEWPRLVGTELETVWPHLDPSTAVVLVVEDESGQIVGCWSLFACLHAEGVWIAPDHRRRGVVAKRLLRGMQETARALGVTAVTTAAESSEIAALVTRHLRGQRLPGEMFVCPIDHEGDESCQQR